MSMAQIASAVAAVPSELGGAADAAGQGLAGLAAGKLGMGGVPDINTAMSPNTAPAGSGLDNSIPVAAPAPAGSQMIKDWIGQHAGGGAGYVDPNALLRAAQTGTGAESFFANNASATPQAPRAPGAATAADLPGLIMQLMKKRGL